MIDTFTPLWFFLVALGVTGGYHIATAVVYSVLNQINGLLYRRRKRKAEKNGGPPAERDGAPCGDPRCEECVRAEANKVLSAITGGAPESGKPDPRYM